MDANKLKKLQELGYKIQQCCGLCDHGRFQGSDWGTCSRHTYLHQKHKDGRRQLSIHKSGLCIRFKEGATDLGGFRDLISS